MCRPVLRAGPIATAADRAAHCMHELEEGDFRPMQLYNIVCLAAQVVNMHSLQIGPEQPEQPGQSEAAQAAHLPE